MKAAIYARYSSDLQSDASIDDQVRLCSAFISGKGWRLSKVYSDRATSGAIRNRPQYQQMLEDARSGCLQVIVAEALDRLSRDQEDIAALFKNAAFLNVKLVTVSEGEITELHIGLKGTMNALYLKDLAQKTKRGLEGKIREGKFAGGNAYGYRTLRDFDSAGEVITGVRVVVPEEADIVQKIFEDFSNGMSPRQIAKELNSKGIAGPGGRKWRDTTIRGHFRRGTGIINNELYIGRLVWNKQHFIKDPATGKRVSRYNEPGKHIIQEIPEFQIISDNLWKSVKARQETIAYKAHQKCSANLLTGAKRNKYLLSGLLICGDCKGGFTLIGKDKYGCANRRNNGTCNNDFMIERSEIEQRIMAGIENKLLEPEQLSKFIDEYVIALDKEAESSKHEQAGARKELAQIEKRLSAVLNAIEQGVVTDTTKSRLLELETKKKDLSSKLSEEVQVPKPDKRLIGMYRENIGQLCRGINIPETKTAVMDSIRQLIDKIVLERPREAQTARAVLYGELGNLVSFEHAPSSSNYAKITVVAGARFELTTFRL